MKADVNAVVATFKTLLANQCPYLWGGNGEVVADTTISFIIAKENASKDPKENAKNASRVLAHVAELAKSGVDLSKAKFFDCSGSVIYGLSKHGLFYGDRTANGLYLLGKPVDVKKAKKGDLVFKGDSDLKNHVGFYIGDGNVIECKGRDVGMYQSKLSTWKYAAHYSWFDTLVLVRRLKLTSPHMTGEDVRLLQFALCSHGFKVDCDGDFGSITEKTVKEFQNVANLDVASFGVVGRKTAEALGFTYNI